MVVDQAQCSVKNSCRPL